MVSFTTCVGACTCCPCTSTSGPTVKTVGGRVLRLCSMLLHVTIGKQHLCLPWCCRTPWRAPPSCCRRLKAPDCLQDSAPLLQAAAGMLLQAQARGLASWWGACLLASLCLQEQAWAVLACGQTQSESWGPGPACSDTRAMLLICQTSDSGRIAARQAQSQIVCSDPETPCRTSTRV